MAFRADEAAQNGFNAVKEYLIPRDFTPEQRKRSENKLIDIIKKYGPVVQSYPSWHPLVTHHHDHDPVITPDERCGYKGLDHTRYFANAFITCPYEDGSKIIDSVNALPQKSHVATIYAKQLDVHFYRTDVTPVLVYCDWNSPLSYNQMIPESLAIPLMLQKELPCWEWAQIPETWETMRLYFLGSPHGSRSSLFVSQETAMKMKKIWELMIGTGMYGPVTASNR